MPVTTRKQRKRREAEMKEVPFFGVLEIVLKSGFVGTKYVGRLAQVSKDMNSLLLTSEDEDKDDIWAAIFYNNQLNDYEVSKDLISRIGYRRLTQAMMDPTAETIPSKPKMAPAFAALPEPGISENDLVLFFALVVPTTSGPRRTSWTMTGKELRPLLQGQYLECDFLTPCTAAEAEDCGTDLLDSELCEKFISVAPKGGVKHFGATRISIKLLRLSDMKMFCIFEPRISFDECEWRQLPALRPLDRSKDARTLTSLDEADFQSGWMEGFMHLGESTYDEFHHPSARGIPWIPPGHSPEWYARFPHDFLFSAGFNFGVSPHGMITITGLCLYASKMDPKDEDGVVYQFNDESEIKNNGVTVLHLLELLHSPEH